MLKNAYVRIFVLFSIFFFKSVIASDLPLNWTQITTTNEPTARELYSMTFDPSQGKIILFGGFSTTYLNDTWEYFPSIVSWQHLTIANPPPARYGASMVFEPVEGNTVLFGGFNGGGELNDTWTFNSTTQIWTNVSPANSPPARNNAAMSFDPSTGLIILFGGEGTVTYNDTWAYNPTNNTWTELTPAISPPPRLGANLVFDPTSGQNILFGGQQLSFFYDDTWAYVSHSNTWTNLNPTTSPGGRAYAAMDFNPSNGQVILFGGENDTFTPLDDTWGFDANANIWTNLNPPDSPSARDADSMVFYPPTGQMILFGGSDVNDNNLQDTWALAPISTTLEWVNLNPSNPPSPRDSASMVFNPSTGKNILFGGFNGTTYLNDTWAFDLDTDSWTNLIPPLSANSPPIRARASMAFDPSTGLIILFGGFNGALDLDDTWAYDSFTNSWTNLNIVTSPSARYYASMDFDPSSGQIILFGGAQGLSTPTIFLSDTWQLNTKTDTWTVKAPTTHPSARAAAAMDFDPSIGQSVLFGGYNGTYLNDTWNYDSVNTTWAAVAPGTSPPARGFATLSFDPTIGQAILFGGYNGTFLNDTWEYHQGPVGSTGTTWTNLTPTASPPARENAVMAYNPSAGEIILFGGDDAELNDTWAFGLIFAPVFTSTDAAVFTTGIFSSFTITTSGFPPALISEAGALPAGITLVNNGNGTATLSGVPAFGTGGTYTITLTAANGVAPNAVQIFTLTIVGTVGPVLPPVNLKGVQKANKFLTQTEYVNILTWSAPTPATSIVGYRIYRDATLQTLIGVVPSTGPLLFKDHNRKKKKAYTYYIVSVGPAGNISLPAIITIQGKSNPSHQ
jgi:N-acetylneuraminic acid mutarotase